MSFLTKITNPILKPVSGFLFGEESDERKRLLQDRAAGRGTIASQVFAQQQGQIRAAGDASAATAGDRGVNPAMAQRNAGAMTSNALGQAGAAFQQGQRQERMQAENELEQMRQREEQRRTQLIGTALQVGGMFAGGGALGGMTGGAGGGGLGSLAGAVFPGAGGPQGGMGGGAFSPGQLQMDGSLANLAFQPQPGPGQMYLNPPAFGSSSPYSGSFSPRLSF